jgi:hypothetical protein
VKDAPGYVTLGTLIAAKQRKKVKHAPDPLRARRFYPWGKSLISGAFARRGCAAIFGKLIRFVQADLWSA